MLQNEILSELDDINNNDSFYCTTTNLHTILPRNRPTCSIITQIFVVSIKI